MGKIDVGITGGSHPCSMRLDLDPALSNERRLLEHLSAGQMYEPDVAHVFLRVLREGDQVIDVGGNAGFFTMLAAALVGPAGRVVSFEPDPNNLMRLRNNVSISEFSHVTVVDQPASDTARPVTFFLNCDDSGGSAMWNVGDFPLNVRSRAAPQPLEMVTTTIDATIATLGLNACKLIKVDTEGAEHAVLRGAAQALAGCGVPFVVAELHGFGLEKLGSDIPQLRQYMEALGYSSYMLYHDGRLPHFVPPGTTISMRYFCNVLFTTATALGAYWPEYLHDASITN